MNEPPTCTSERTPDPEARCDECGAFGAMAFGDRLLCPECYAGKGSCCPEFGKDDLWRFNEEAERPGAVERGRDSDSETSRSREG